MPLISSITQGQSYQIYIWRMVEKDLNMKWVLEKEGIDLLPIKGWHPKRQREWLTGRYLAHTYLPERITSMLIGPSGKPYFENAASHFSLSHSKELLGIVISSNEIGLDIQIESPGVARTAHKFVTKQNIERLPNWMTIDHKNHILWCVKEAVFKAYGLGVVDFRSDILIEEFQIINGLQTISGNLIKANLNRTFVAHVWKSGQYYHACALLDD